MVIAREKGREPFALRRVDVDLGPLSRADGSARFTQGKTSVLVSAFGPVQAPHDNCDGALLSITWQRRGHIPTAGCRTLTDHEMLNERMEDDETIFFLRETLQSVMLLSLHPNTQFSLTVQVLHDDGSLLSAALNGCMAALLDAGVPCTGTLGSATVAVRCDGSLILDPDAGEEKAARVIAVFAHDSQAAALVAAHSFGTFPSDRAYSQAEQLSRKAAQQIFNIMKTAYSVMKTGILNQ
eukprot:NODE_2930_length_1087_cov_8.097303_g2687_i0.p1 GENE.NODE_2930_length_1087_cov_8.097303_g2687_i0~~NODE_2930_length_1087_cov_8.097303_g2687_i0.p1  ORF type:complete len:239 (+),score=45.27 NODE_2930_length_1087_cov_8.097303_g2687_i0:212-928(+)